MADTRFVWAMSAGALLTFNSAAMAQKCVEVSEDGLQSNECEDDQPSPDGGITGASGVPFGTAPDWQNDIRRQVAALQFADMNNDGQLDLVVGCFHSTASPPYTDWRNFIYYNAGGQLESQPSWYSADQVHTTDIQIGDLNLDTYPDIFAANGGSSLSPSVIYFGGATGPDPTPDWSSSTPIATWAVSATLFDLDHDRDLDIVTTNQSFAPNPYRPLYMFRNNDGVIENTPFWQSDDTMISNGISIGDYDNDGWEDVAVAKWVNFEAAIYKNDGGALQGLPIWTTGDDSPARGAAFYDFDGNGWLDLILGYDPTRMYTNTRTTLTPTWESTAPFAPAQELRLHDVDGDGDQDLAEVYFSTAVTHIYLNNDGVLDSSPTWSYDAPTVGNALAFGDINGDGCDDLAIGYSGDVSIRVFYAQCPKDCPADTNGDGSVNINDLLGVISAWGTSDPAYDIAPPGGDGVVNIGDLLAVIASWGDC